MSDDATPLSDLLKPVIDGGGSRELEAFYAALLAAEVGVIVHGIPEHRTGRFRVGAGEMTMPRFGTPDGRAAIKACADPRVFARRFDPSVNAFMRGREVLEMVLKVPDADGLLVCSAASFHSLMIPREDIPRLLERFPPRAWWKFW